MQGINTTILQMLDITEARIQVGPLDGASSSPSNTHINSVILLNTQIHDQFPLTGDNLRLLTPLLLPFSKWLLIIKERYLLYFRDTIRRTRTEAA